MHDGESGMWVAHLHPCHTFVIFLTKCSPLNILYTQLCESAASKREGLSSRVMAHPKTHANLRHTPLTTISCITTNSEREGSYGCIGTSKYLELIRDPYPWSNPSRVIVG